MKEERATFDLIERYLQGALGEEEKAFVEDKIKNDSEFAQEVASRELVNSVIIGANQDLLREKMKKDIAQLDAKGNNNTKWFTGGAVVLLAALTASYFYFSNQDSSNKSSYESQNTNEDSKIINEENNKSNNSEKAKEVTPTPFISSKEQNNSIEDTSGNSINNTPIVSQENPKAPDLNESKKDNHQQVIDNKTKNKEECKITFHPTSHSTCKGENKGSIEVDHGSISGGTAPFVFTIDHLSETSTGTFLALEGGKHIVTIKDNTGCTTSMEVVIHEKHCPIKKSFSINPDYETWKIPYTDGESGTFTILNRAGIVIFKGHFGSNGLSEWNGSDNSGASVEVGMYIYILEYSNGKTENGQITIVR